MRTFIAFLFAVAVFAQPVVTCSSTKASGGGTITCSADVAVTWSLTAGSVGSISAGGVYTAPASITAKHQMGGCQVFPNNNVLNTRIDALPLEARSDAWITTMGTVSLPWVKFAQAFPLNVVTDSTPTTTYTDTSYTDSLIGYPMWHPVPRRTQQGEYAPYSMPGYSQDKHFLTLNRQTCVAQETYNGCKDPILGVCSVPDFAASLANYDLSRQALIGGSGVGFTDAAGLPILATTLKADELERVRQQGGSVVKHALRFTLRNAVIHPSRLWPASANAVPDCADNAKCPSYGARFRLKSSYSFSSPTSNPYVPIIIETLKQYGMFLADGSAINLDIAVDDSSRLSPLMKAAFTELTNDQINPSDFEAVDESGLQLYADSYAVNPANAHSVASDDFVEIVATATVGGATTKTLVTLIGPTVGVERFQEYLVQGTTRQVTAWANGTADTLTYTMTPAVTGASVSSAGLITAPASLAAPAVTRVRVALAGDANTYSDVIVTFLPLDSGVLRIATGYDRSGADSFTDAAGKIWWSRAAVTGTDRYWVSGYGSGTYDGGWPIDQGKPAYTDHRLYQYTQEGNKDILHTFTVPNGNYTVTLKMADKNSDATAAALSHHEFHVAAQGVLVHRRKHLQEDCGNGRNSYLPCDWIVPAVVSDGQLSVAVHGLSAHGDYYSKLSALQIEPATDTPSVVVSVEDASNVTLAATRQLYAVGWWLPQSFTWSVVSGAGTVDANGLYTAPSTTPYVGAVVVRATSTADPTKYGEHTLTLVFGTMAVTPASATVNRGETQQLAADINGVAYPRVTWSMTGQGSISSTGLYYAPLVRTGDTSATVTATSIDDAEQAVNVAITIPAALTPAVKIDAGSTCYQNVSGWGRDSQNPLYSGIWSPYLVGSSTTGGSNNYAATITGADAGEVAIYRCERSVNGLNWFGYNLIVPPGKYDVRFLWAEHRAALQGTGTWGAYLMDVVVNGTTLLTDYNPVEQAGGVRIAHDRTFSVIVGLDRSLVVRLNGKQASQTNQPGAFLNGLTVTYTGPAPFTQHSGTVQGTLQ